MARKKKPAPPPDPESVFSITVNGHTLSGEERGGEWTFECASWPDIARKWKGDTVLTNAVEAFMSRALAGAVKVRQLAENVNRLAEGGGS